MKDSLKQKLDVKLTLFTIVILVAPHLARASEPFRPICQQILGAIKEPPKKSIWARNQTQKARLHAESREWIQAIEILREVVSQNPRDVVALTLLGIYSRNIKNYDQAIEYFLLAAKLEGADVKALANLFNAYMGKKDFSKASETADKILVLNPNDVIGLDMKSRALINLAKFSEAISYLDRAIELSPNDIRLLSSKGEALMGLKKYHEAISVLDQALNKSHREIILLSLKGQALLRLGRADQALTVLDQALSINAKDEIVITDKAAALLHLGRYVEALTIINPILGRDSKNIYAINIKVRALVGNGQYGQALDLIDARLMLDQRSGSNLLLNSLKVTALIGKRDLELAEKALEVVPLDYHRDLLKAKILFAKGQAQQAIDLLKSLVPSSEVLWTLAHFYFLEGNFLLSEHSLVQVAEHHLQRVDFFVIAGLVKVRSQNTPQVRPALVQQLAKNLGLESAAEDILRIVEIPDMHFWNYSPDL